MHPCADWAQRAGVPERFFDVAPAELSDRAAQALTRF